MYKFVNSLNVFKYVRRCIDGEREESGLSYHQKGFLILLSFKRREQASLADAEQVREAQNKEDVEENIRDENPQVPPVVVIKDIIRTLQ